MNALFALTPKKDVEFLYEDFTVRQALEKMEFHRYSTIPVIERKSGKYLYSLREGDFLWYLKDRHLTFEEFSKHRINEIKPSRIMKPVGIDSDIDELYSLIIDQNYVPVIDDEGCFIGIITRKKVLDSFLNIKK
jgi:predicted transcriptional regulator